MVSLNALHPLSCGMKRRLDVRAFFVLFQCRSPSSSTQQRTKRVDARLELGGRARGSAWGCHAL